MVTGDPAKAPSAVFHVEWAYWESSHDGSTAHADGSPKRAGKSQSKPGRRIRKVFTLPAAHTAT
jgi:hypothetical protein